MLMPQALGLLVKKGRRTADVEEVTCRLLSDYKLGERARVVALDTTGNREFKHRLATDRVDRSRVETFPNTVLLTLVSPTIPQTESH